MGTVSINKKEKLSPHFTLGEMTKTSYRRCFVKSGTRGMEMGMIL